MGRIGNQNFSGHPGGRLEGPSAGAITQIDFNLAGCRLSISAMIPDRPMRLADLMPLAWSLSDQLVRRTLSRRAASSPAPSCRRGCAACCRYVVPLSAPEAFRLADQVACLPAAKRAEVEKAFDQAADRILAAPAPPQPDPEAEPGSIEAIDGFSQWYADLQIGCPLLHEECCEIYSARPTSCREHLVTSAPGDCRNSDPEAGRIVAMPFSISRALGLLAAELERTDVESVLLPLALRWSRIHSARRQRRWPARMLMEKLAGILGDLSAQTGDRPQPATHAA